MMTRYPDGITGRASSRRAAGRRGADVDAHRSAVRSEEEQRELEQIICDDLRTLEWWRTWAPMPIHLPGGAGCLENAPTGA